MSLRKPLKNECVNFLHRSKKLLRIRKEKRGRLLSPTARRNLAEDVATPAFGLLLSLPAFPLTLLSEL